MSLKGLLIEERLLVINPKLASHIGLNEAIVLQQVLYWMNNPKAGVFIGGYKWIYNSVPQWAEQFPFWSEATIKRALSNLRSKGHLVAEQLSDDGRDKTLFYRLSDKIICDLSIGSNCTDGQGHTDQMTIYTKNTSKTSTNNKEVDSEKHKQSFESFWSAYPRKVNKKGAYKSWLRIKPNAELVTEIMSSLSAHAKSADWTKDNGKFIPHATTWLNNERWNDEVSQSTDIAVYGSNNQTTSEAERQAINDAAYNQLFGDDFDGVTIDV